MPSSAIPVLLLIAPWCLATVAVGHKNGTCVADCGAKTYKKYTVGVGPNITYRAADHECLAHCRESPTRKSCGKTARKVAKLKDENAQIGYKPVTKLCCEIKACTYKPQLDTWLQARGREMPVRPLIDMTAVNKVYGKTCLCCNKREVGWNSEVNQKCKLGFKNGGHPMATPKSFAFGNFATTMGLRPITATSELRQKCHEYCANFPQYRVAKKALRFHTWKLATGQADVWARDNAERKLLHEACLHYVEAVGSQRGFWNDVVPEIELEAVNEAIATSHLWFQENPDAEVRFLDLMFRQLTETLPPQSIPLALDDGISEEDREILDQRYKLTSNVEVLPPHASGT